MRAGKIIKRIGKVILWVSGIWIGLLLLIQIVLSEPVLTRIINRMAEEYIDADVTFGNASASVFRHFPRVTLNLEDVDITYPHDRFDSLEKKSMQGFLLYKGCGETADTLASIHRLSASLSLSSLMAGEIRLPHIEIDNPRIFAHYYDEEHANWNIFGLSPEDETNPDDTTGTDEKSDEDSMNIILKKISIEGDPTIVYTDSQDSLFTLIKMRSMSFDGNFETDFLHRTIADADIREIIIAGRYGRDTLAAKIDMISLAKVEEHMKVHIQANTFIAADQLERMIVPINFCSDLSFPEGPDLTVSLTDINADIATIPASGDFSFCLKDDRIMTKGRIDISDCKIQNVLHGYLMAYLPELADVTTDTEVSARATLDGHYHYTDGTLPQLNISVEVPDSEIDYRTFPEKISMALNADFHMDTTGRMRAEVTRARLHTYGMELDATGGMYDITGEDPDIKIDGSLRASLDSLRSFLPDTMAINAHGDLMGELHGSAKLSHLGMYEFSRCDLKGNLKGDNINIQMPEDSIDIKISGLDINLAPEDITSKVNPGQSFRLMGVTGKVAKTDMSFKDAFTFKGKDIYFSAKNSADKAGEEKDDVSYLGGRFNAGLLTLSDSEGTSIKLEETRNSFQMRPKPDQPSTPILSLANQNLRITYLTQDNRVILTDSKINAMTQMNTIDRARKREATLDSLAKIHPDIPRDSLFRFYRSQRNSRPVPKWMTEDDFKSSDIKFDLNETAKKYFREWAFDCSAEIRTGIIMTPYFPLRNIIRGAYLSLDNNHISIDSIKVMAGESEICAKGSVNGLRRAMLRGGGLDMDLDLSSDSVNADELLKAYNTGSKYESRSSVTSDKMTNAEFFKQVTTDTAQAVQSTPALVVIPGNISARISLDATGIKYKDLDISSLTSDMIVKERCVQMTNTSMRSNMGGFDLDAFYTTRSKKDIRTGFCLDLTDITSERVIGLIPEINQVMPMIGSVHGLLDCEIAATASLDTTMNIIMPTVNGIIRLRGKDLSISDDEVFTSIARKLMFKNKQKGEIDMLQIEGAIKDNRLEVFPFILTLDRYTLGVSGVQNMDMSYKHHVSVLRSPLLIRVGLNISGPDYDNMKFKVGKALYRVKKMPSFSEVIDQTKNDLKYSICNIFDLRIYNTIDNTDMQALISKVQNDIGYINAAEMEMEELSKEDMKKLEERESYDSALEKVMKASVISVQKALENN